MRRRYTVNNCSIFLKVCTTDALPYQGPPSPGHHGRPRQHRQHRQHPECLGHRWRRLYRPGHLDRASHPFHVRRERRIRRSGRPDLLDRPGRLCRTDRPCRRGRLFRLDRAALCAGGNQVKKTSKSQHHIFIGEEWTEMEAWFPVFWITLS